MLIEHKQKKWIPAAFPGICAAILVGAVSAYSASWTSTTSPDAVYTNTGNVGIGISTPASLNTRQRVLEVNASGAGTTANPGIVLRSGTGYATVRAWELLLSSGATGYTDFQLTSNTTGRLFVSGSSGFVGIGMTAPQARLDVAGDAKVSGLLTVGNRATITGATANQEALVVNQTLTGNVVDFRKSGVSRFMVTEAGRVGVNTVAPGATFDVSGNLGFFGTGLNGDTYQRAVIYGDATNGLLLEAPKNASGTKMDINLSWRGGGAGFTLKGATGNVGIGTLAPSEKLDVIGGIRLTDGTNGTIRLFGDSEGSRLISGKLQGGTRDFRIEDEVNGEIARFTADGKVGFATATPRESFDVYGNAVIGNMFVESGGNYQWSIGHYDLDHVTGFAMKQDYFGNTKVNGATGTSVSLEVGGVSRLVAYDAGVSVTGELMASSVKTSNWTIATPDYVFEKDYQLASLERVEKFVQEKKHLPEIPSAKEMKAKGLDLAEMNMRLLKKVEELTLYAIKQEKEIKGLKKAVASIHDKLP